MSLGIFKEDTTTSYSEKEHSDRQNYRQYTCRHLPGVMIVQSQTPVITSIITLWLGLQAPDVLLFFFFNLLHNH